MSINILGLHKANSLPGNCTCPLYANNLDTLKPTENILAANQIKSQNHIRNLFTCCTKKLEVQVFL